MRQPRPVYRGQGNQAQQISRPDGPTYPGQVSPYEVNGAPAGGDANTLDGQDGVFYLARANHTGTQTAATISDFAASVNGLIAAAYTAADVLAKLLTVDGAGSGLDADLLDGQNGSHYLDRANHTGTQTQATIVNLVADLAAKLDAASYTAADVLTKIKTVDGSGSGLDADLLQGTTPTAFGLSLIDDANSAAARTTLGLVIGTDVQAQDAQLAAIASLTPAADQVIYWTSATAAAMTGLTAFGRSLVDDADATAARATLALGTAAVKNTGTSGNVVALLDGANTWSGAQTMEQLTIIGASSFISIAARDSSDGFLEFGDANTLNWYSAAAVRMSLTSGGNLNVNGEVRCDSFRIDQAPTAAVVAQTHHVPVNINGTTYKLLLAS